MKKHSTFNAQRSTPNGGRVSLLEGSALNVECWFFVLIAVFLIAPGSGCAAETNDPIITALRQLEQHPSIIDPCPTGKVQEIHFAVLPGYMSPISYRMSVGPDCRLICRPILVFPYKSYPKNIPFHECRILKISTNEYEALVNLVTTNGILQLSSPIQRDSGDNWTYGFVFVTEHGRKRVWNPNYFSADEEDTNTPCCREIALAFRKFLKSDKWETCSESATKMKE
ncbi:MAG: hypothetical protein WCH99_17190 [Verrucomicrobiota bacterium]